MGRFVVARLLGAVRELLLNVVLPAALTALAVRYLVASSDALTPPGFEPLTRLGKEHLAALSVGLFLFFSLVVRYWRPYLPGARRWAWQAPEGSHNAPPADLAALSRARDLWAALTRRSSWRRLERGLDARQLGLVEAALGALDKALGRGDAVGARANERIVRSVAAPVLRRLAFRRSLGTLALMAFAVVAALLLRAQGVQLYRVLSASMLPTLAPGDGIMVSRVSYRHLIDGEPPRRGDVIVFHKEILGMPDDLVKRVIGLPGDRITMRAGRPSINGWEVPACDAGFYVFPAPNGSVQGRLLVEFLEDAVYLTLHTGLREVAQPYQVKPGEVFVLGDNRNSSDDSRFWNNGGPGGVPLPDVVGRVERVIGRRQRDGSVDLEALVAELGTELYLDGIDVSELVQRVETCVVDRPSNTSPPAAVPTLARAADER